MDKPKELTGKVVPYIELGRYIGSVMGAEDLNILNSIRDFLRQPFTPELLNLFKGWRKNENNGNIYAYFENEEDEYDKATVEYQSRYSETPIYKWSGSYNQFPFKTLNDFITLCTLAGVELEWK